jgi:Uma2 family endonuclease
MPQVIEPIRGIRERAPTPLRWTRGRCAAARELGILTVRYELVDGQVINKTGEDPPHAGVVSLVVEWLAGLFGPSHVRVRSTIEVAEADPEYNEPEPDIVVTREPQRAYFERHPDPDDLLLVVEVADRTLGFDRTTKAALYALAGIREYWLLDLEGRQLLIHRQGVGDIYRSIVAYGPEECAATLARPEARVRVAGFLPPRG